MKSMIFKILLAVSIFYSCRSQNEQDKKILPEADTSLTFILTDNQKKVLTGAKKCLEAGFKYDNNMAYHVLKYRDTVYTGSNVYPLGDLDPELGVCTEVTIRALRWGGVCDLQEEIHKDIITNWNDYPMSRWKAKKPDANIDHRRVPNQLVWFKKNWQEVTDSLPLSTRVDDSTRRGGGRGVEPYQPGDVVVWDMNGDSWADHIGIISDVPLPAVSRLGGEWERGNGALGGKGGVIHNFPSPGYVAEEDVLNRWKILGVFRIR